MSRRTPLAPPPRLLHGMLPFRRLGLRAPLVLYRGRSSRVKTSAPRQCKGLPSFRNLCGPRPPPSPHLCITASHRAGPQGEPLQTSAHQARPRRLRAQGVLPARRTFFSTLRIIEMSFLNRHCAQRRFRKSIAITRNVEKMCGAPEAPPGLGGAEGGLGVQRFAEVTLVAPRDDPL